MPVDKSLEMKAGLEIHAQLNTKGKLFCGCSTGLKEKDAARIIKRKQHAVASEMGDVDRAAQFEFLRNRTFNYQLFNRETCLVDADCEPPHNVNPDALKTALQVSLLLHCEIPSEIHVMRKTVIDGSNTSGFQRTMIVGLNGWLEHKGKRVEITQISLEEDAAAIVSEKDGTVTYRLNRLGVPLIEIDTGILEGFSPEEVQEIAYAIGLTAKSTGKVKRGLGSIRQDVNVSIKGGNRVEIKGTQDLGMMSKIIELEVKRQTELVNNGKGVEKETRTVREDGATVFARPLPGSARMYPESDVCPIVVSETELTGINNNLPEPWDKKLERFKGEMKLSDLLAREMVRSDYLNLFENIMSKGKVEPSIAASFFTSTLKDLSRKGEIEIENLDEYMLVELFDYVGKGLVMKESLPEVAKYLSKYPQAKIEKALEELHLTPISADELVKIIDEVAHTEKDMHRVTNIVMSKVRGRVSPKLVIEEIKKRKA